MRGKAGKIGIFNWVKHLTDGSYYTKEGGSWPHFMIFPIKVQNKGTRWLVKSNVNAGKTPVGTYIAWRPKEKHCPDFDWESGTFGTLGSAQAWLGRG